MTHLDIRDLALLDALTRTGNVSLTAEEIGLSQPSVSVRLGKLRRHFNDPLFVRTSAGMQATPRAMTLMPAVRSALNLLRGTEEANTFDPKTSDRIFRLSMTNTGQIVIIAKLKNALSTVAPHLRLDVVELTPQTPFHLESGEIDLAMGFTAQMGAGFYQQKLFSEYYVCMVRHDHPRIKERVSRRQFLNECHVAVKSNGTAHWLLDKALDDAGASRRIALWVPSFLGLAEIVRSTDLLALVPIHLAKILCRRGEVRYMRMPIAVPSYDVKQYWHERFHREPGNKWMREFIAKQVQA